MEPDQAVSRFHPRPKQEKNINQEDSIFVTVIEM